MSYTPTQSLASVAAKPSRVVMPVCYEWLASDSRVLVKLALDGTVCLLLPLQYTCISKCSNLMRVWIFRRHLCQYYGKILLPLQYTCISKRSNLMRFWIFWRHLCQYYGKILFYFLSYPGNQVGPTSRGSCAPDETKHMHVPGIPLNPFQRLEQGVDIYSYTCTLALHIGPTITLTRATCFTFVGYCCLLDSSGCKGFC